MSRITVPKLIAALVVVSAILAPAASARPVDTPAAVDVAQANLGDASRFVPPGVERTASGANPTAPSDAMSASASPLASSGFDWGDAGIGAAGALTLLGLGAGGALVARRTGRSQTAAS